MTLENTCGLQSGFIEEMDLIRRGRRRGGVDIGCWCQRKNIVVSWKGSFMHGLVCDFERG